MEDKNKTTKIGKKYEELAVEYLLNKGYKILNRNYKNPFGEIDIIAEEQNEERCSIVYVEVKYRSSRSFGDPLSAVDFRKMKRISKAASCHYSDYSMNRDVGCRFDVIAIYGDGSVKHILNAFDYC